MYVKTEKTLFTHVGQIEGQSQMAFSKFIEKRSLDSLKDEGKVLWNLWVSHGSFGGLEENFCTLYIISILERARARSRAL